MRRSVPPHRTHAALLPVLLFALVAAGALTAGCSGCDGKDSGTAPATKGPPKTELPKGVMIVTDMEVGKYGGTLVRGTAGNPKTFNPVLANEASSSEVLHGPVYASCWGFDNIKQEAQPSMCESFERSEDGLTYTFTIRDGIKWSDGAPVVSDDFGFNFQVITDPAIAVPVADLFKQGTTPDGKPLFPTFEKIDDRHFRFKLHKKDVLFEFTVGSLYIVPAHKWRSVYEAGDFNKSMTINTPGADMPTSGPFIIDSLKSDERVVLKRNPHYWKADKDRNRLPYVDRFIFVVVPDFNVEFLKFRDGETDMLELRPEHYDPLKRGEAGGDYVLRDLGPEFSRSYLMFNLDNRNDKSGKPFVDPMKAKWFNSKLFRKAISHAIDREGMVRTVMAGRGLPIFGFYSPANKKWKPTNLVTTPYSLATARKLLTEDGFTFADGKLKDRDGNHVEFTMITNSENATRIGMLNVIKDDLTKLGITAHIRPVPFNDVVTSLRNSRNFDAILLGWGTAVPPDPAQSKNVILSSGASHAWNPQQPTPATPWEAKMDELLHKSTEVYDYEERKKYTDELFTIFSDELPQLMLAVENSYVAGRKNLGNFRPANLRPKMTWNVEEIYFKTPRKR